MLISYSFSCPTSSSHQQVSLLLMRLQVILGSTAEATAAAGEDAQWLHQDHYTEQLHRQQQHDSFRLGHHRQCSAINTPMFWLCKRTAVVRSEPVLEQHCFLPLIYLIYLNSHDGVLTAFVFAMPACSHASWCNGRAAARGAVSSAVKHVW
jgi:hypothetical protein